MARAQVALLLFSLAIPLGSTACGGDAPTARDGSSTAQNGSNSAAIDGAGSDEARDVRAIHRSRCGNCHVRVEPGERTRAELETALLRHRKRVKMSEAEWSRMIDYLAKK